MTRARPNATRLTAIVTLSAALCAGGLTAQEADESEPNRVAPAAAAAARGQALSAAEIDHRTAEIADELRCPVCRNQSVLESSSQIARQMQVEIREKVAAGWDHDAIVDFFVERYGSWILLQPEPAGFNLLVYLVPALALLVGLVASALLLRRWSGRAERDLRHHGTPDTDDLSPEDREWLEAALRG